MKLRWSGGVATVAVHGALLLLMAGALHRAPLHPALPPATQLVSVRPAAAPAPGRPMAAVPVPLPAALRSLPEVALVAIPALPPVAVAPPMDTSPVPERLSPPGDTAAPGQAMDAGPTPPKAAVHEPTGAGANGQLRPEPQAALQREEPATFPAGHRQCADQQTARHYPALLRERGVTGSVRLRVKVDENGHAAEVVVASGSGFRLLDEAARRVAESCPYVPARRGDQRLPSWIEYAVRFALQPAGPSALQSF